MSERNVPFLLNGAAVQANTWTDAFLQKLSRYFRQRRFRGFDRIFPEVESIIDFGGTPEIWLNIGRSHVLLVNIDEQQVPPGFHAMKGDARKTLFPDQHFDLAFSNSTVEHVGTWEDQKAFAREMRRVGRRVFCQTPARGFFFRAPLFHALWFRFLTKRYWFIRHCTYYGPRWKPSRAQVADFQAHLRLLSYSEVRELLPDCTIHRERFLGMTKAYIAIR